jgi:hypothetical protein
MYAKNFPITQGSVIRGINTTIVVKVHAITLFLKSFIANRTAVLGLYHSLIFSEEP